MDFKIFPGTRDVAGRSSQSVVVEWRDPIFREPTRTRITRLRGGHPPKEDPDAESPPDDWPENLPDALGASGLQDAPRRA